MLGWHEYNTTHFNLHNIKYNIHLEIIFFTFQKQCIHFKSSTHIQNNIVQQKYNIYLEISFLHSKRSAYTLTQIQNNIVQQKYNILGTRQMLSINIERIGANSRLKFIEQKHYAEKITVEFWNTKNTIFFNSKTH